MYPREIWEERRANARRRGKRAFRMVLRLTAHGSRVTEEPGSASSISITGMSETIG